MSGLPEGPLSGSEDSVAVGDHEKRVNSRQQSNTDLRCHMERNKVAVRVISDGSFLLDGGPVFGPVPKILWERSAKPDRKNRVRLGLNSLLAIAPQANVMVDAGIGSKEPEVNREIYGHRYQQAAAQFARARRVPFGTSTS